MESIRWRYQPEFRIVITINGQPAGDLFSLTPTEYSIRQFRNYGVMTSSANGMLTCSVKQRRSGVNWVPEVVLDTAHVFAFVLRFKRGNDFPALDFFGQGTATFGRRIFYANNLNATGVIDSNLAANAVRLTPAASAAITDAGSVSGGIPSAEFTPGSFNQIRAGQIRAGGAVTFSINTPIAATARTAGLDLSMQSGTSYLLRLEGGTPLQERVVVDPSATFGDVSGVIEIFRDTWFLPNQPRAYTVNFTSV